MRAVHLLLAVFLPLLLLSTSAQRNNDEDGKYQAKQYRAANPHDLIQGNCTSLEGKTPAYLNATEEASPGRVVSRIDRYWWPNTIYCIRMFDRLEDGTGGFPFIESGGVGRQDVALGYNSQPSKPLEYYIEFFVHPGSVDKSFTQDLESE